MRTLLRPGSKIILLLIESHNRSTRQPWQDGHSFVSASDGVLHGVVARGCAGESSEQ
jgi:hypothetical protein